MKPAVSNCRGLKISEGCVQVLTMGQRGIRHLILIVLILLTGCSVKAPPPSSLPTPPTLLPTPTSTPLPRLVFATRPPTQTPTLVPSATTPTPTQSRASTTPRRIDRTLNILLLGADRRSSKAKIWRTDTIMLVLVDRQRREVAVISVPRDTYVTIPGYGKQRINVVDYFGEAGVVKIKGGGPALLKKVFWTNFRVRVDHYVRIDLPGFAKVVDVLGGVDVDITCPHTVTWGDKTIHFKRGIQHLSGEELMVYVRARKGNSDIDRARRQQRAILAMRDRARELNLLPRIPALYATLRDSVQTDLSLMTVLDLGRLAMDIPTEQVHGRVISYPLVRGTITGRGESVLIPDLPAIRRLIEEAFEQPPLLKATEQGINCEEE